MNTNKTLIKQFTHDMKTPLATIRVVTDELKRQMSASEDQKECMMLLGLSVEQLNTLIDKMLNKMNGYEEKTSYFDIHELLDTVVKEFNCGFQARAVIFKKIYDHIPLICFGSSFRLMQALRNIIKNALEAMEHKGMITISTFRDGENVSLSISDTGPGMSDEIKKHIFQDGFTSGKANGHGIGLAIVKDVVQELAGQLNLESALGKGTKFTLNLPLVKEAQETKQLKPIYN